MRRRQRIHKLPRSKFVWLKKINIFKYLSILLIIIFIYITPVVIKKLIKIDKIECQSQYGQCSEQLVNNLQYITNSDLYVAKGKINQVLEHNKQVSSYLIQYKIPSTLKVELVLKKPKFAIKNSNGNYFLIDKDGFVVETTQESNLPTLLNNNITYKVGDSISDKDIFALKIIEKISLLYSVQTGIVEKNSLQIKLNEGVLLYFPLEGDVDVLVGSLRLIFSRLNEGTQGIKMEDTITISDVKEIDLRFTNPVIR